MVYYTYIFFKFLFAKLRYCFTKHLEIRKIDLENKTGKKISIYVRKISYNLNSTINVEYNRNS